MASTLTIKIITPLNVILESSALLVTMPGEEGMFGVMPNHALLLAALKPGLIEIEIDHNKANNLIYFVYGGMTEVTGENINVVTDFSMDCTTLDKNKIIENIALLKIKITEEALDAEKDLIQSDINRYQTLLDCLNAKI